MAKFKPLSILKGVLGGAVTGGPAGAAIGLIGSIVPQIAKAFDSPIADMALKFVGDALGVEPTQTAIEDVLKSDPAALAKIRMAEIDFEKHLADNGIDLVRIHAADRDSARAREASTGDSWTPRILAATVTVGFFGILFYILKYGLVDDAGGDVIKVMLGSLGAAWIAVMNYYFGSSAGSAKKTDLLGKK
jgi:hypothetical protein